MNDADVQRDLGKMGAQIDGLAKGIATLTDELRRTNDDLDSLRLTLARAEGGWKVLAGVATVSATVGGLIASFLPMLFGRSGVRP